MKTTKLVIGIIMLVLAAFIIFQSFASGIYNAMENSKSSSGSAGVMVALAYIIGGIIYLSTKNSKRLGGDIAAMIVLVLGFLLGISNVGAYSDLSIWSWLAFIIGIGFFTWHLLENRKERNLSN